MDISAKPPTKAECLAELKREIGMRRAVFPKWIKSGRIAAAEAAHRIKTMEAVYQDYEQRHFGTQPGLDL